MENNSPKIRNTDFPVVDYLSTQTVWYCRLSRQYNGTRWHSACGAQRGKHTHTKKPFEKLNSCVSLLKSWPSFMYEQFSYKKKEKKKSGRTDGPEACAHDGDVNIRGKFSEKKEIQSSSPSMRMNTWPAVVHRTLLELHSKTELQRLTATDRERANAVSSAATLTGPTQRRGE